MVAECFVYHKSNIEKYCGDIKSKYVGISNQIMLNHCCWMSKSFNERMNLIKLYDP